MSVLTIYPADWSAAQAGDQPASYSDAAVITDRLRAIGVQFEVWQAAAELAADATQEDILAAYRAQVDALKQQHGFVNADVVSLGPDHPERQALRQKFISEHTHSDFEVRFFVAGQGLFYLHCGDQVYGLLCNQGDLISVPAGTKHWFDMGERPSFTCIRLFSDPEGWVADYTGSPIARQFPLLEQFVSAAA